MPNLEIQLPAEIGEGVAFAGQAALVVAWSIVCPRFVLGGSLDGDPQLLLQVITEQGEERWLDAADVTGLGEPTLVSVFLPFTGGDPVLVGPSWALSEVRGSEVIGRRLEPTMVYRVHLAGTPAGGEIEVDVCFLAPRLRDA